MYGSSSDMCKRSEMFSAIKLVKAGGTSAMVNRRPGLCLPGIPLRGPASADFHVRDGPKEYTMSLPMMRSIQPRSGMRAWPVFLLLLLSTVPILGFAATCTSKATGNWNDATTWTCTGAGTTPTFADAVVLASSWTVSLNSNDRTAVSLTINTGATLKYTSLAPFRVEKLLVTHA